MVKMHLIILYQVDHCQLLQYDVHLYCFCFSDQFTDVVLKCQREAEQPGITFVQDEQQQYIV